MYVPFAFSLDIFAKAPHLWWFYKALDFAKRTHSAMIAQELYCDTSIAAFRAAGRGETNPVAAREMFDYQVPEEQDLQWERIYRIPDSMIEEIVKEKGSISDARAYLTTHADSRFCAFLEDAIERIQRDSGKKIDAFYCFGVETVSLAAVAKAHDIPLIHLELGSTRNPIYINTAYWDLADIYGVSTVEERWTRFQRERQEEAFPLFEKKEILALLLRSDHLYLLDMYDQKPVKKVGIALGYGINITSGRTHLSDAELLLRVEETYGQDNILIRQHRGDPYGAQYPYYYDAIDHKRRCAPKFILDCETIISLMSGTCIEAMLYDRKAITLLPCPAYYASGHQIGEEGLCADTDFINFFMLCYLIPLECVMDVEYVRWRLTMPPEREIYQKHLEFYFKKNGLPLDLVGEAPGKRLEAMLAIKKNGPEVK